jgi:hypothetical protein
VDLHGFQKYTKVWIYHTTFLHKVPRLIEYLSSGKCWAILRKGVLNTGHFTTRLCYRPPLGCGAQRKNTHFLYFTDPVSEFYGHSDKGCVLAGEWSKFHNKSYLWVFYITP